jgi:hypothetical protein
MKDDAEKPQAILALEQALANQRHSVLTEWRSHVQKYENQANAYIRLLSSYLNKRAYLSELQASALISYILDQRVTKPDPPYMPELTALATYIHTCQPD